jgi:hypothetical protein
MSIPKKPLSAYILQAQTVLFRKETTKFLPKQQYKKKRQRKFAKTEHE